MRHVYFGTNPSRESLVTRYRQLRKRSRDIFEMVVPDAYFTRPIALRNPIVFYEGHLPAFSVNTLVKIGLGHRGIDERLEMLFARGIELKQHLPGLDLLAARHVQRLKPGLDRRGEVDVVAFGIALKALRLVGCAEAESSEQGQEGGRG